MAPSAPPGAGIDVDLSLNTLAERLVHLTLRVGHYDEGLVDAYIGPPEWQAAVTAAPTPLNELPDQVKDLLGDLEGVSVGEDERLRKTYLVKHVRALGTRVDMLMGTSFTFDRESEILYDAVAPRHDESDFQQTLQQLDELLPGTGHVTDRYTSFKSNFIVPNERLDAVFTAAINESRKRTLEYIKLPANESFAVEYVRSKPWGGYNWFKGNGHSVIQVNIDVPVSIDRAIDLAAHEGYPGHHVYNVLREEQIKEKGWVEFYVFALYSPQALIAEGTANFGIHVAFPHADRIAFERDVLFPLAGLNATRAGEYYKVMELVAKLDAAGNEAARKFVDGEWSVEQSSHWLSRFALMPRERVSRRLAFVRQYRSYVINYHLGEEMVKNYIEGKGGTEDDVQRRWEIFTALVTSHTLGGSL